MADEQRRADPVRRATVTYSPGFEDERMVMKPYWYADNGYETCSFTTKEEAIAFCWKRWRVPPEGVRIDGPEGAAPRGETSTGCTVNGALRPAQTDGADDGGDEYGVNLGPDDQVFICGEETS